MAITIQLDDGSIDNANSYTDSTAMRAFWLDRGVDLTAKTEDELSAALVKATDFLDARYLWVGHQKRRVQGTQWPRLGVSSMLRGIPPALVGATCLMANRALSKDLAPDPTYDASGQLVQASTKKVGPIEVSLTFAESTGRRPEDFLPQYPEITLMLRGAGLIEFGNSGQLARG